MFNGIKNTIRDLNSNVNNATNCERAKKLRRSLLFTGITMALIGFVGVIVCFILFATAGLNAFSSTGFSARILVPFFLIIPFGIIGGIGTMIAKIGFTIVVAGYVSKATDTIIENSEENSKAKSDKVVCSYCGHKNDKDDNYCESCGGRL